MNSVKMGDLVICTSVGARGSRGYVRACGQRLGKIYRVTGFAFMPGSIYACDPFVGLDNIYLLEVGEYEKWYNRKE
jgi:hypothetical protein